MTLRPLSALQVREAWGWIRNGLLQVGARSPDRWLPEDVYLAVQAGKASVYAIEHAGDDVGFGVFQRLADVDGACLFVWALWIEPGTFHGKQRAALAAIEALAREVGARRIRMHSARREWRRLFDLTQYVFEREV